MTAELDRAIAALEVEFADEIAAGLIVHLGTYNCRRKNTRPTGPWSEHAWPNAVDVMLKRIPGTATPTLDAKRVGYRVAAWMSDHPELWSEVFWQILAHDDHVHGTATPRRNHDNKQIPPCAGGPADPDPGDEMELSRTTAVDGGKKELTPYVEQLRAAGAMTKDTQPGGVTYNDELAKFLVVYGEAIKAELEAELVAKYNLGEGGVAPGTVFKGQVIA